MIIPFNAKVKRLKVKVTKNRKSDIQLMNKTLKFENTKKHKQLFTRPALYYHSSFLMNMLFTRGRLMYTSSSVLKRNFGEVPFLQFSVNHTEIAPKS